MIAHSSISVKQEAILNAALRLFVKFDFHGTPTSKIASEAGIAHGFVFTYYKMKDELVAALYQHVKENLRAFMLEKVRPLDTIRERFGYVFFYSVKWSLAHPEEFYFTQQIKYSAYLKKDQADLSVKERSFHREIYDEALKEEIFRPLSIDMIAEMSMSQIVGMYYFLSEGKFSVQEETLLFNEAFNDLWRMLKKFKKIY